jgi:isochorismate synthase EntC
VHGTLGLTPCPELIQFASGQHLGTRVHGTLGLTPCPELIQFANGQHLGTRVHGTLAADRSTLALVGALHPT